MPDAVVYPATNEKVSAIAAICSDVAVPIVAFGSGTSFEGHVAVVHGGIRVDFSTMGQDVQRSAIAAMEFNLLQKECASWKVDRLVRRREYRRLGFARR